MRGHVLKRGRTWSAVYDEGVTDDGKRRQRWKGGFATRKEAQQFLNETLSKLDAGLYVAPSKQTFADYLETEWLPAIAATVRPLTLTQYRSLIRNRIKPRIGHLRLQALTGAHLNAMYRELEQEGLAAASLRQTHAVVSRALRDAVRWGKVQRNAAQAADPPALADTRATAWTARELGRFLEHVRGDRLFALWRLAATTGMRRGELLGVQWLDLDLEAGTLTVDRQLVPTRGGCTFGPPKSKRSRRKVALDAGTVEVLRAHREAQLLERAYAGDAYQDADLLFANELGAPIHPQRLTEWFGQLRKAAGVPVGTLHILRHTAATLALTNGVPLHVLAARIGDRPETVLKTYAHLLPTSDAQAAEQVAALIAG
jgi:integrase